MTNKTEMDKYFEEIEKITEQAYSVASPARKKGFDPEDKVDIPLAKNMAERVEGLISAVAPQIKGSGITKRIQELEKQFKPLDWRIGLKIAEEVAKEKFCKFKNKLKAMEIGIRTGFAYLTVGIVSAPLEGFIELKIKKRKDGKGEYFSVCYAGPIRGAGGTAAATSVLLADYVRVKMGYQPYDPTEGEINRYITEINDYHERITNLQYFPSEEEIRFLIKHIPVEINGDPTEKFEVSNYKDLDRVETPRIRGGVSLVLAEGLSQKASKLWKRVDTWAKDFDLEWEFLEEFLKLQKKIKAQTTEEDVKAKISPNFTYITDLVAGRPVLTHPLAKGGFRLRYGRSRVSGFSAAAINPLTMKVLNKYIATGTQLKVERPGKAAAVTPCDSIEGPIIKIKDGSVIRVEKESDIKDKLDQLDKILFLGDILFNYGDFSENNHNLVPPGYCEEWWVKELEKATVNMFGNLDLDKLAELVEISRENLEILLKNPLTKLSAKAAIQLSKTLQIPLHPRYTYHWGLINKEDFDDLFNWLDKAKLDKIDNKPNKLILPFDKKGKEILETIGLPHLFVNNEWVVIEKEDVITFLFTLGLLDKFDVTKAKETCKEEENVFSLLNKISGVKIRDKSGTFIGARMGRPEKAKMRKMTGSPHVLFPVSEEGGRLRCFQSTLEKGHINADFPRFKCTKCNKETIFSVCELCNKKTKKLYYCKECGYIESKECKHGKASTYNKQKIDIKYYFNNILKKLGDRTYPDLIKGVKGTSNKDHLPEHLIKGILRAKHNICVNKDGTTRYDMSELPITHFKPKEIGVSLEKLKELGYTKDIHGKEIVSEEQVIEIKPQDLILPNFTQGTDEPADKVLLKVANFVDELLVKLYDLKPYYNLNKKEDLIGKLVIGLAPHISAGMVGRIIGFSKTQGCFAHPLFHAALRRDCDGDECCVILLMDALLNFSRQYLPDKRGSRTMDSPLVLTSKLIPSEVDDMVHGIDIVWEYPLEFYEAALEYKKPSEVEIDQLGKFLGTEKQYEGMGYTHKVSSINEGVNCSAYKTLPSMEDKLKGQMQLAEQISAVNESDVARLVIEKHFLKDTKGNLRKFSQQQFRCVACNEKFRRPPLIGRCTNCGGRIIFTISEGSIVKYLGHSMKLAEKYNVPSYLKQSLVLLERRIEGMFGRDKEKQEALGKFGFG